jgi:periplasmic protein CpxP/Spy
MKYSNNKILTIAVVLLLITNIALVALMMFGKNDKPKRGPGGKGDPFAMMEKELGMTEVQKKEHLQFREEYFKKINPLFDSVRYAKAAYFALVKDTTLADSVLVSSYNKITAMQTAIDRYTFDHFRRVRALYTPGQQLKYDSLVQKMMMQKGRRDSSSKKK